MCQLVLLLPHSTLNYIVTKCNQSWHCWFNQIHNFYHISCHLDAAAFGSAHFGRGTGRIYLDNVDCTGSEDSLLECSRSFLFSCSYGIAGVRCQGKVTCEVLSVALPYSYVKTCTHCSQCYWQLYVWRCSSGGRL